MNDLAGIKTGYFGYSGLIESNGVTRVCAALNHAVNERCDEAHICFNSLGGYVGDGIYLYNHIRSLPLKVIFHNLGSVSSIAVSVFLAASERYCSEHAMFMIHPTSMPPGQDGMAWERLQSALNAALAEDQRTENILRERTNLPAEILSARRVRDVHILPAQALEYGIVHQIREFALPKGHQIIQI